MEYFYNSKLSKNRRLTIGYLDENAYDEYHGFITEGLLEASRKYDMNVIRFGHFSSHITSKDEMHATKVLDFIEQFRLDGLIFLGWARAANENLDNFKKRFSSIPIFSMGSGFEDIPCANFPGDYYIKEVITHLLNVHHFTRIAFIAPFWPDNRMDTYIKMMKDYGLYDPELVITNEAVANLDVPHRGRKAVSILLDERKSKVEAIISLFTDETNAILSELRERGINVPGDIAVTSYEDGELGKFSSPAMTTVYFPWKELGYSSCEKMYELLTEGHIPMITNVPGKIIIRDSCGCISESIRQSETGDIEEAFLAFEDVGPEKLMEIANDLEVETSCSEIDFKALLKIFRNEFVKRSKTDFLSELEMQLRNTGRSLERLRGLTAALRRHLLPYFIPYIKTRKEIYFWADNLFQQVQALVQEKINFEWAKEEARSKTYYLRLKEISQILITNYTISNLMDSLVINLSQLDIPSCYIYTFKNTGGRDYLFDECAAALKYCGNCLEADTKDFMPVKYIINETIFKEDRPYLMAAQLLYVGDEFYGFSVFEAGPMDVRIYQILSINISTSLNGAILFEKLDDCYKRLVEQAHRKGMADISTGILHNIGNILSSVNVSTQKIKELAESPAIDDFLKASGMLESRMEDIEEFLCNDPKGKKLMEFYLKLGNTFSTLKEQLESNIERLSIKTDMIDEIISDQQNYTGIKTTIEKTEIIPVIEDALKMSMGTDEKLKIRVVREYKGSTSALAQKAKLFHVIANLIKNAIEAMAETPADKRMLKLSIDTADGERLIRITDQGHGIPSDTLDAIFAYGYTTKKGGHGFGLHSCANYMTEMGGRIRAESEGVGKGASFVLCLKP